MLNTLAFFNIQGIEWIVLLIVAVLLFGPNLPAIARKTGKTLGQFKKGMKDAADEFKQEVDGVEEAAKAAANDSETSNEAKEKPSAETPNIQPPENQGVKREGGEASSEPAQDEKGGEDVKDAVEEKPDTAVSEK